jgi:hypothetical protein
VDGYEEGRGYGTDRQTEQSRDFFSENGASECESVSERARSERGIRGGKSYR